MESLSGHSHDFIVTEADDERYVSIDIEADGPAPEWNSMLSLGAVTFISKGALVDTFSANLEAREDPEDHALVGETARGVGRVPHAGPGPPLGHARRDASLGTGGRAGGLTALDLQVDCSHTALRNTDCRPCGGGRPYGHHPVAIAFRGVSLHVCFIDEAGDLGALSNPPLPDEQPVLVIGGLFVDAASLPALTGHFLNPQTDRHEGGIVVSDAIARRNGSFMFR